MTEDEHAWASRDLYWMLAFLVLLVLAGLDVVFVWVLLGLVVVFAAVVAYRVVRRRRAERANADNPFWVDDFPR